MCDVNKEFFDYVIMYWGRHGCVRMVVGFTITCAISVYHH